LYPLPSGSQGVAVSYRAAAPTLTANPHAPPGASVAALSAVVLVPLRGHGALVRYTLVGLAMPRRGDLLAAGRRGVPPRYLPSRRSAGSGGEVVERAGHERNLTRTCVRFKTSGPEATKLTHMATTVRPDRLRPASKQPPARGACSSVTTPSPVAFEEAPARAPSRAGVVSAERRGPYPGPPRSSIFFPRPLGAFSHNNNRGALFVPSVLQEET
jgi:hypothetical protein